MSLYASCGKCDSIICFNSRFDRVKWLAEHDPDHIDFVSIYSDPGGDAA